MRPGTLLLTSAVGCAILMSILSGCAGGSTATVGVRDSDFRDLVQETTTAKLGVDDLKLAVSALSTQIKQQSGRDSITNDVWTLRLLACGNPVITLIVGTAIYLFLKKTRVGRTITYCKHEHGHTTKGANLLVPKSVVQTTEVV